MREYCTEKYVPLVRAAALAASMRARCSQVDPWRVPYGRRLPADSWLAGATPAMISGNSHYLYCICVPTDGSSLGTVTSCSTSCSSGLTRNTYVGLTVTRSAAIPIASYFGLGSSKSLTGQAIIRVS